MKKIITMLGTVALFGTLASVSYAQTICPTLTAKDVEHAIDKGIIATEQDSTLADEAGVSKAQVLIDEPTANPFDTFYQMYDFKNIDGKSYMIYVGNILGKAAYEAIDRAKKILLSGNETVFNGQMDPESKTCMYKMVNASPTIANYPFKSEYETAVLLVATPGSSFFNAMPMMKMRKHRA